MKYFFIFIFLFPMFLFAESFPALGPLTNRVQHPIYLQHLNLTPMRPVSLEAGRLEVRTDIAFSNLFELAPGANSTADLDMELLRTALQTSLGLGEGFEVGVEIPFYRFEGGFLDAFIDTYHRTFGFPRGGRELFPNGRFSYRVTQNGTNLIDIGPLEWGLGDITLHLKHFFWEEQKKAPALAWFFDFKIPTGERDRGTGSGTPDFGLGVALEKHLGKRFHLYANAGPYLASGNDLVQNFLYEPLLQFMLAGDISIFENWSAIVQFQGGTPMLHGLSDQWNGVPLDLIVGFRGEEKSLFGKHDFLWQFGFSEDVTGKGPSVDFTLFASIGVRTASLWTKKH